MLIKILLCMLLMNWSLCAQFDEINNKITLQNVDRSIDLSSQIAKIVNKINIKNDGTDDINYILICTGQEVSPAYLLAQTLVPRTDLKVTEANVQRQNGKKFWKIEFNNPIVSGKMVTIEVSEFWTQVITPYPKSITQEEKQFVRYQGNLYLYSPYQIKKVTTIVALNTRNVENYSEVKPTSFTDDTLIYGAYYNIAPFNATQFVVHYENNAPFLIIKNLQRTITVSHWGNIAVKETFEILHVGAKLKGPFSRPDFTKDPHINHPSINSYKTLLPASAIGIYYRDDIGNISTSDVTIMTDAVELNIKPRFPLFGGWKTRHIIGYSVPTYEYLYISGYDEYLLKMRLLDHVFDDMVVQKLTTKIILPEGVHSVDLFTPYSVERLADKFEHTITLIKENMIENHIQDFQLGYKYSSVLILEKPLLIVMVLYSFFILFIIYVRLDFSIAKDTIKENKLQAVALCKKIMIHQDKRTNLYQQFDGQLSKLKTTKDINSFNAAMKSINKEYKMETNAIAELCKQIKPIAADVFDKIQELRKLDKNLKELYMQHQSLYYDKFIPGKIARSAFADAENTFFKKRNDLLNNINRLYKSFE